MKTDEKWTYGTITLPNQPVGICPLCKREIHRIELYSCGNNNCPIQTKVTM